MILGKRDVYIRIMVFRVRRPAPLETRVTGPSLVARVDPIGHPIRSGRGTSPARTSQLEIHSLCRAHRGPSCERARCTPDIEAPSPEAERRAPMQPKTLRLGRAQHAASALRRRSDARLRELRLQRRDLRVLEPHQLLELLDLDLQNLHGLSHLGQLGVLLVEKLLIPPSIAPL